MGAVSLVSLGTHHQIIHHKFTFANLCSVAKDKKFQSQFISLLTTNISYKMRCFAVLFQSCCSSYQQWAVLSREDMVEFTIRQKQMHIGPEDLEGSLVTICGVWRLFRPT